MGRFLLWQIFGVAMVAYGYVTGVVPALLSTDQTYLAYGICGLVYIGVMTCGWKLMSLRVCTTEAEAVAHIAIVRVIANTCLALGLVGTVYGLVLVSRSITPEAAGSADAVGDLVAALLAGLGTALPTTLAGVVGRAWLLFCDHMLRVELTHVLAER